MKKSIMAITALSLAACSFSSHPGIKAEPVYFGPRRRLIPEPVIEPENEDRVHGIPKKEADFAAIEKAKQKRDRKAAQKAIQTQRSIDGQKGGV